MLEREWTQQCRELLEKDEQTDQDQTFNLMFPGSRCPNCNHKITLWENIPILSYILLKGRCSECSQKISIRYPIIEFATAVLSITIAWHFGFSWQTLCALLLTWALISLSMIDFDHKLLPDNIVLPFLWLGLLININGVFTDLQSAVIGAIAGYLSLWSIFWIFKLITGKEGMGYGDFKLLALFGAWLGWQYLLQIVLLSSLVGAILGIALIVIFGRDRSIPIPFGPYLATAGWISLLWGKEINQAYLGLAGLG
jgi:leader peptidase (prepilin peptidase)/N-methyltransferase